MKPWQTAVRYGAIVLAVILIINIVGWGLKIVGAVLGFASSGTLDESKTYECDADTDKLEINISAAQLIIRIEKCESITVKTNLKGVSVKERSNTLKIDDNKGFLSIPDTEGFVEIMIPEGAVLREIDLDLGAGETLLSAICADEVDIDGGAGEVLFTRCEISDLDLDMGVGALDFRGRVTGKADISLGVGVAKIQLLGDKDEYRLSVDKGIGNVSVDGQDVGSTKIGNGGVRVNIDGGVGDITIDFE